MIVEPATTIEDVIETMTEINAVLDYEDGVACFNHLYLNVTSAVRNEAGSSDFEDVTFLDALDVTFANFYFDAFARVARGEPCPAAWAPLFGHRDRPHTSRLQFALVGMNAHINHDLPLAVVSTAVAHAVDPFCDSPYQRDFFRVNDLLASVEDRIRSWFAAGLIAEIDKHLKRVDDAVSMWCIHGARRAAWDTASLLYDLRGHPGIGENCEHVLATLVNLAGRAVLV